MASSPHSGEEASTGGANGDGQLLRLDRHRVGSRRRDAGAPAGALRQAHPPPGARRVRRAREGQLGLARGEPGGQVPDQGGLEGPRLEHLHEDFARSGLRPFHTPLGIMLDESRPQSSRCIRCNTCDGYPCLVRAKADAQVLAVDPALEYPNVTLLTGAYVERLETSPSGREVTKVVVQRDGAREEYKGGIVVVSCGAINSAALLLRSGNDRHPQGLANGSGVVGRHYMGHVNSVLMAVSKCPNPTVFQKSLSVNDYYFGDSGFPYPMGHISFVGKLDGVTLSAGAPSSLPTKEMWPIG